VLGIARQQREYAPVDSIIQFLITVFTLNGTFRWHWVTDFLFSVPIFQGVLLTVLVSVISQVAGSLIGLLLYFLRRSRFRPVQWLANGYVWLFRGTPLLIQILIFSLLFSYLGLAQRMRTVEFSQPLGFVYEIFLDSLLALVLGLSLNEGAYMAEIVRAGIDSIDAGQMEAAKSLGMTYGQAMRRIVLPQALRVIVPPLGNEFNSMLKSSSLAYVVSFPELLVTAEQLGGGLRNAALELYFVASIWYLILTSIWTVIQVLLERRLNASNIDPALRAQRPWWQRVFGAGERAGVPAGAPEIAFPVPGADRGAR
jgi:polar amino acid transport system permease protein